MMTNRSVTLRNTFWALLAIALFIALLLSWAHELPTGPFYRQIIANLSAASFFIAMVALLFVQFRIFAPYGSSDAAPRRSLLVRATFRGGQIGLGLYLIYRCIKPLCAVCASTQPLFARGWLSEQVAWEFSEALFQSIYLVVGILLLGLESSALLLRVAKPVIALSGVVLLALFIILLSRLALGNNELAPCLSALSHCEFLKR